MQLLILKLLRRLTTWIYRKADKAECWIRDRVCERGGHNWNLETFGVILDGSHHDYRHCLHCDETEKRKTGTISWLPFDA